MAAERDKRAGLAAGGCTLLWEKWRRLTETAAVETP